MKKIVLLILIGMLIFSCSTTKNGTKKTQYFDENNMEISKRKFKKLRSTNALLDIPGDSINHRKLTGREAQGKISSRPILEKLLEDHTGEELDSTKPIVIIYYPGKDPCNSGGATDKEWIKRYDDDMENGIYQIAQVKPVYIYKDATGLERYFGIRTYHKDPERSIERLFFKYHYPCGSFVVISKSGDYMSYFGEYANIFVWRATEIMNK